MTTKTLFHTSIAVFVLGVYALVTTPEATAAASCEITVEATDAMAFSTKQIDIAKTCKEFTLNLKHVGKLGKNVMGHNIVIAKAVDQQGVLDDGGKVGAASDFVKAKDARVIAATKIIGSGETTSVKFSSSKLDAKESYVFFCSFPGHAFMMKGVVKLI